MDFKSFLYYFIIGGLVTTIIVWFEESNMRLLSGLATLMPVFTLIAYIFIGESRGGRAVSEHASLVLVGTLIAWVPYMLAIILLAPRIGSSRAIAIAFAIFFALALAFLLVVQRFGLFQ